MSKFRVDVPRRAASVGVGQQWSIDAHRAHEESRNAAKRQ